jgi:hypothetical protein
MEELIAREQILTLLNLLEIFSKYRNVLNCLLITVSGYLYAYTLSAQEMSNM